MFIEAVSSSQAHIPQEEFLWMFVLVCVCWHCSFLRRCCTPASFSQRESLCVRIAGFTVPSARALEMEGINTQEHKGYLTGSAEWPWELEQKINLKLCEKSFIWGLIKKKNPPSAIKWMLISDWRVGGFQSCFNQLVYDKNIKLCKARYF